MQIWMSEEIEADVADAYQEVRTKIESSLSSVFEKRDYGPGLVKLYFIAMLLGDNAPAGLKEIKRYKKKDKTAEFRLVIDHEQFKAGDHRSRAALIVDALLRSLDLMGGMGIPDVDIASIRADLLATAESQGWRG